MNRMLRLTAGSLRQMVFLTFVALLVIGCSSSSKKPKVTTTAVDLFPESIPAELPPGATYQLQAAATKNNGSVEDVTATASWQSSDSSIIEVTAGLITAKAVGGPVEITATSGGITSAAVSITVQDGVLPPVQPPVTTLSVSLSPATAAGGLPLNESFQVKASATQSDGKKTDVTTTATWTSSDPATVSVTSSGVIKGEKAGGPIAITAASGGRASAPLNVTVNGTAEFKLTKLEISPFSTAVLPVGERRTHIAIGTWSDGLNTQNYEISEESAWASANEAVVSVPEPSVALAVAKGNTTIAASYGSPVVASNTLPIYVEEKTLPPGPTPDPDTLVIAPAQFPGDVLLQGFVYQADVYLVSNTGNQTVQVTESSSWSSSDENILVVSDAPGTRGQTQAKGAGKASLTVTRDGKTSSQEYTVGEQTAEIKNAKIILAGGSNGYPVGLDIALRVVADVDLGDGEGFKSQDITQYLLFNVKEPQLATVTNEGFPRYLSGVEAGDTRVQAWLANVGVPLASAAVQFQKVELSTITLSPGNAAALPIGLENQFKANGLFNDLDATVKTFDITRQVAFKSQNSAIANVSNAPATKGVVTAQAVGSTAITAEFDTVRSRVVTQEVKAAELQSISIEPASSAVALKAGALQFKAVGFYSDNSQQDVTANADWLSSNTDAIRFSPRTLGKGRAILYQATSPAAVIQAVVSGVAQAKTTLNVNDPAATRLTLTASGTTVKQGETLQLLTTQGDFSDGTQNDVTLVTAWLAEGDNPNASVTAGVVTGVAEGKATIVAKFEGFEERAEITITAP